ncbi:MAG: metalloregulator ArsR/SmtB family transcription factor [Bacteroidales bacterium]|jgi:DNA-binding transcriptional ArsR family regulator
MVLAKTGLFDTDLQEGALLFKALSHPARLHILRYLSQIKSCITGDISEELPLSRTTVNQHLAELKKAGLIQGHVSGKKTNYCLNPIIINQLKSFCDSFFEDIETNDFKCE